ncbi:MAG: hypothetical protein AAGE61_08175 [Pseudomonadota bacterium]
MKLLAVLLIGIFAGASPSVAACFTTQSTSAGVRNVSATSGNVQGQIIVRFEETVSPQEAERIIARVGGRTIDRVLGGSTYIVELLSPSAQSDVIRALSGSKGVVFAEPSQAVSIPEDPDRKGQGQDLEVLPLPKVE